MERHDISSLMVLVLAVCASRVTLAGEIAPVYPGRQWATKSPEELGLSAAKLKAFSDYAGGFGCVVRHGYMVYTWGDASRRMDVASAAKPVYAHFLFKAVEDGLIFSTDEPVCKWEPRLKRINGNLGCKDSRITWRHMANQVSCYGLVEEPGTAYAYNDWQMSLLWDTLFTRVYGATHATVDSEVLHPQLTDLIGCEDDPTFMAFGVQARPGRLAISPRDFARFGLLYLRGGRWKEEQLLSPEYAQMAVTDPVPNAIPRAGNESAAMIPGQRTIGSQRIPDNQTDHMGSYSWLWWINGVDREGKRHWLGAPVDTFGCFGHGGKRAVVVVPNLDLIVSWNDTRIEGRDMENKALALLLDAVREKRPSRDSDNIQMRECADWRASDVEHTGNPFDVTATVTLRHWESGVQRTMQMFYDGEEIVEDLNNDVTRPHLYEERHSYLREGFNLNMGGTRRLLWWEAMAGGMGGFYPDSPYPYPNPEQLRMHCDFWHKGARFLLDMHPANTMVEAGYALWSPSSESGVLYRQNGEVVTGQLPATGGPLVPVAFDTLTAGAAGRYDLGVYPATGGPFVFAAPYRSDWVCAVGSLGRQGPNEPTGFQSLITADPEHPQWPRYVRPGSHDARPFFMCGPGDPEDFLYRGTLNPDGTPSGDQMQLIEKLRGTGANCIYLMAVRSHGGDGDATHNPFIDHDPAKGVNSAVLDQWEQWFTEMDRNGIVIYFFLYDDSTRVWNTGDEVDEQEREFIRTLVNRFEHHGHLIWCIAEEYAERLTAERVRRLAALIRAEDDSDHPIAVHKNHGLDFSEFADDPNIDQFAIQYNVPTAEELHAGVVQAWQEARGRYSLNLAEAADWGVGPESRKKCWACAMGGASVMILRMDIAGTAAGDLRDCGNVVRFFEMVDLYGMEPHDELASAGTQYVLALPGERYAAYAVTRRSQIGLKNMRTGTYELRWFDCVTAKTVLQESAIVDSGAQIWQRPADLGGEIAVYIRRVAD